MKILVLDNYDSFTYNLVHYLEKVSDAEIEVHRNDQISLEEIGRFDKILLSPGPGIPSEAGILQDVIRKYASSKSILGICLGMQAIGEVFGGTLRNLDTVFHGVATPVKVIKDDLLFTGIPAGFKAGRYHSWVVDTNGFPDVLEVTAVDDAGQVMALKHKTMDVRGVQFHPESILTEYGTELIGNWANTQ
ncbi:MAG: trpG [Bacteroidetes bacterium]|nr:trpG [Bacteroidota bacterium]